MRQVCRNHCRSECLISRRAFLAGGTGFAFALSGGCFNRSGQSQSQAEEIKKEVIMGKTETEGMKYVTYCGLYCGLCSMRGRIPQQAHALRDMMAKEGFDQWGQDMPNFKEFWAFLNRWSDLKNACKGCRQGGGNPECEIRKCAQQKNIEICPACEDYPCKRITDLNKIYPTMISGGRRLKEIGSGPWIEEQKKRAETGFVYADIRNPWE
jgi:hypothetical protein